MAQPFTDAQLKADVILCNPPYIKNKEDVAQSVLRYEPHLALFGGEDGLDFYRQLFDSLDLIRHQKAIIAFEMGYDQREIMQYEIQTRFSEARIHFEKDMNNLDRMCFIYFNC